MPVLLRWQHLTFLYLNWNIRMNVGRQTYSRYNSAFPNWMQNILCGFWHPSSVSGRASVQCFFVFVFFKKHCLVPRHSLGPKGTKEHPWSLCLTSDPSPSPFVGEAWSSLLSIPPSDCVVDTKINSLGGHFRSEPTQKRWLSFLPHYFIHTTIHLLPTDCMLCRRS